MSIKQKLLKGTIIMGFSVICGAAQCAAQIKASETEEAGARLYHIENDLYHAVFAPAQAMFPLYYHYKPSGKDILVRKPDVAASFRSRDGIQLCLPCVGDSNRRLPSKGLLHTAEWKTELVSDAGSANLSSATEIVYDDPVSGKPAHLACRIKVSGTAQNSVLTSDFFLENIGTNPAQFMFVAHARLAPEGEYKDGDYIHTPAEKCWIGEFQWPALSDAGVKPHSWATWPVPGMDSFAFKKPEEKQKDFAYAFIPANWLIVGNNQSKNFVLFDATPVKTGSTEQPAPFYCILRRDNDYLVEIGVSREIDAKYWTNPGATVTLAPGEILSYTLRMAAGRGLSKADAGNIVSISDTIINLKDNDGTHRELSLKK